MVQEISERPLALAIKLGALCFGRRLADLFDQQRLDVTAICGRELVAKAVKPLVDTAPQVALLLRDGHGAVGESGEIGNVPLLGLAVNARGLDQDRTPVDILLRRSLAGVGVVIPPATIQQLAQPPELGFSSLA